jgi:hypothetical protein
VCVFFFWGGGAKGLNAKDSQKEMFLVYAVKCLSRKGVKTGARNSLKDVRESQMMPEEVWKWLRQAAKRLLCCGFRRTGKAMGQV